MNLLPFSESVSISLGWTILHSLWQFSALSFVVLGVLMALKSADAKLRYGVACAGLASMLLCAIATFLIVRSSIPSSTGSLSQLAHDSSLVGFRNLDVTSLDNGSRLDNMVRDRAARLDALIADRASDDSVVGPKPTRLDRIAPLLAGTWLAGLIVLTIRSLGGWILARRWAKRSCDPIVGGLARRCKELSASLGIRRRVSLFASGLISNPAVLGCYRSTILLPASAITGLPANQLEALIVHELAHIRRFDYVVNLIQIAIENLLFYHPAVWWVSGAIRAEREVCCDDMALRLLGEPRTYAAALASLEQIRVGQPALAASGGFLLPRIRRILGETIMPTHRQSPLLFGVMLLTIVASPIAITQLRAAPPSASTQSKSNSQDDPAQESAKQSSTAEQKLQAELAELKQQIRRLEAENRKLRAGSATTRSADRLQAEYAKKSLDSLSQRDKRAAAEEILDTDKRAMAEKLSRVTADLTRNEEKLNRAQFEKATLDADKLLKSSLDETAAGDKIARLHAFDSPLEEKARALDIYKAAQDPSRQGEIDAKVLDHYKLSQDPSRRGEIDDKAAELDYKLSRDRAFKSADDGKAADLAKLEFATRARLDDKLREQKAAFAEASKQYGGRDATIQMLQSQIRALQAQNKMINRQLEEVRRQIESIRGSKGNDRF